MAQVKYYRCPKDGSLLELTGTFNFFAPNPYTIICPVDGSKLLIDNYESYNWKVSKVFKPDEQNNIQIIKPESITQPETKEQPKEGIFSNIKFIITAIIIILVLVFLIRIKK
jgi:hypothetical protein